MYKLSAHNPKAQGFGAGAYHLIAWRIHSVILYFFMFPPLLIFFAFRSIFIFSNFGGK
jgi:hypothetical protein